MILRSLQAMRERRASALTDVV